MIFEAYCVGKIHNMLPSSIMIIGAYCVVYVHNMLKLSFFKVPEGVQHFQGGSNFFRGGGSNCLFL